MNANKIDILCDQVIDVALVVKEAKDKINSATFLAYPQKFVNRIDSVVNYCHNLFVNVNHGKHTEDEVNDIMVYLMANLIEYKLSYNEGTYGNKVMNSLYDIVKTTFVEFNN